MSGPWSGRRTGDFLLAANVSAGLGGQITAVLANIPGDAPDAAIYLMFAVGLGVRF